MHLDCRSCDQHHALVMILKTWYLFFRGLKRSEGKYQAKREQRPTVNFDRFDESFLWIIR